MIGIRRLSQQFLHSSRVNFTSTRNSSLAELRKSTGYSISNCKAALGLFPDNVAKAEEWLHDEAKRKGWSKWSKVQSRSATQGLIGTYSKDTVAAMLEVNCETDFVARNSEFQSFVEKVLISCINHIHEQNLSEDILKISLDQTLLNSMKFESTTISELLGAVTCKFNEKTVIKRAVCYKVKDGISLSSMSHPCTRLENLAGARLGKYGAVLAFKQKSNEDDKNLSELGQNLCQHIIGMNPESVGQFTDEDLAALHDKKKKSSDTNIKNENVQNEQSDKRETSSDSNESVIDSHKNETTSDDQSSGNESDDESGSSSDSEVKETNETRLLHQPFLLDPTVTVGETVLKSIDVLHFDRFECGASDVQESDESIAQSAKTV